MCYVMKCPVTGSPAPLRSSHSLCHFHLPEQSTMLGALLFPATLQVSDMAFCESLSQAAASAFHLFLRLPLRCLLFCALQTDATAVVPCRSMAMARCPYR